MFDANGKIPFIATEFIPGITLERLLAQKSMSGVQKRVLLFRMSRILKELHAIKVVHRDVRPANLIVQMSHQGTIRRVVLIDYSTAVKLDSKKLELPFFRRRLTLLKNLGGVFKPEALKWDDAYSFFKIAQIIEPDFRYKHPDIWSKIKYSLGRVTYTHKAKHE